MSALIYKDGGKSGGSYLTARAPHRGRASETQPLKGADPTELASTFVRISSRPRAAYARAARLTATSVKYFPVAATSLVRLPFKLLEDGGKSVVSYLTARALQHGKEKGRHFRRFAVT